ncbi:Ribosomal RNA large subunit methyltransferase Cfr [Planctomycetes bacterium MalM25]|nr:Ribosomal RNA large subunit methyltransferase Cfr [Planctomycetes bacterium MalM25]
MIRSKVSFYNLSEVDRLSRTLRIDPQMLRHSRIAFYKKSLGFEGALACLPQDVRGSFAESVEFHTLRDRQRFDSNIDHATKWVSRTDAGLAIETVVLMPATGRVALCVSSQVGCAAACEFCATGRMGIARNLTAAEILDQITLANEELRPEGKRVRNIVFMGMGEPMHNEAVLQESLATLQEPTAFDHPASRLLVSTVGVPEPLVRTAELHPRVNYAISLHAADQAVRERIIPLAKKHSLIEIRAAIERLNTVQPAKTLVMIEYLMLDGVNDTQDAADALIRWLTGLRVHVNLIPYNRVDHADHLASSPRSRIEAFGGQLRAEGFPTTIRYSLGRDIDAACGQLVQSENRRIAQELQLNQANGRD